jgi:hypothetical protein
MLDGLDQVDWTTLWACSPPTEIPKLIRTLAFAEDHELRQRVIQDLSERLLYQDSSVLEVTAPAVPFVLEVLTAEAVEEKASLLVLLVSIAEGTPFVMGTAAFSKYADEASAPPELQARLAIERRWVQQAHEAVEHGVPIYLMFLAHPEAETRRWAAYLLSHFSTQAPVILPALQLRLDHEDDEVVQATILLGLAALLSQHPDPDPDATSAFLQRLSPYLRAEAPFVLRCTAALAYARCARVATPTDVVQVLVEVAGAADALYTAYWQLPEGVLSSAYSVTTWVCETLALIEPAQAVAALITILQGRPSQEGLQTLSRLHETLKVSEYLLVVAFPQGASLSLDRQLGAGSLTQTQHVEVLRQQAHKPSYQEGVEVEATLEAASALLSAAFSQEHPLSAAPLARPGAPALTPIQRAALAALAEYDPLWQTQQLSIAHRLSVETTRHLLLERFGLPPSCDGLRHLLAQHGTSPAEPMPPALTWAQARTVSLLVGYDFLWGEAQELRPRREQLLMSYGLPPSRDACRALLA